MYKCLECGCVFEQGEEKNWEEPYNLDYPPYEHFSGCPSCLGNFEIARKCQICGEYFCESELTDGLCKECAENENE